MSRILIASIFYAVSFASVTAGAAERTFQFSVTKVETIDKADCGMGADGKLDCDIACIAHAKLVALNSPLRQEESATVTLTFKDPIERNETGEMSFSFYFAGSEREGQTIRMHDSVLSVACSQVNIIRTSVECSDEKISRDCSSSKFIIEKTKSFGIKAQKPYTPVSKF